MSPYSFTECRAYSGPKHTVHRKLCPTVAMKVNLSWGLDWIKWVVYRGIS